MDDEFELLLRNHDNELDEEVLLNAIIEKVEDLLKYDPELLMSHLYRMDVQEKRISKALNSPEGLMPARVIGQLILDRQKERLASKEKYKQKPIDGWEF
jgi:hypothetical protein